MTFVMLSGVYPTDSMIRSRISSFKTSCLMHNDLVIGNMIVRGDELILIDFDDARRSSK